LKLKEIILNEVVKMVSQGDKNRTGNPEDQIGYQSI
jgi:hypothetical protein